MLWKYSAWDIYKVLFWFEFCVHVFCAARYTLVEGIKSTMRQAENEDGKRGDGKVNGQLGLILSRSLLVCLSVCVWVCVKRQVLKGQLAAVPVLPPGVDSATFFSVVISSFLNKVMMVLDQVRLSTHTYIHTHTAKRLLQVINYVSKGGE